MSMMYAHRGAWVTKGHCNRNFTILFYLKAETEGSSKDIPAQGGDLAHKHP